MKLTEIFLGLLFLTACKTETENRSVIANKGLTHVENNEIGIEPYKEFTPCDFDKILNNSTTPELAKRIYLDKEWDLNKDDKVLGLLDSLRAKDQSTRPFYFKVVTKTFKKTDGYYSEGLGIGGKEYVENNTNEFVSFFNNKECFTDKDLETWANIVFLEFQIEQDDIETTKDEHLIYKYCRKLRIQSKNFTINEQATISKFTKILENRWSERLNHI